jgi:adenosine kinase
MSILVCGSLAYDNIMVFRGHFKDHILPDKIHMLSVSFLVPEMRREFGGCAGNIAYNLKLLGDDPTIVATVGSDFRPYSDRLRALGISTDGIVEIPDHFTAQCFITTDLDDNQLTAFHPGAMSFSDRNATAARGDGPHLAIIGPDGREGMQAHAARFAQAGIPFIFDPGQAMPIFSGDELLEFMRLATYATFNDYEISLASERTGRSESELAAMVEALIVTRGGEGSTIFAGDRKIVIPSVKAESLADPTGCGDAYRAGLIHGLMRGWDWHHTGRLASLLGSLKIAHRGPQNHHFTYAELAERYVREFGEALPQVAAPLLQRSAS